MYRVPLINIYSSPSTKVHFYFIIILFFYALQEGKNIYLYVTINDGHLTSKTQVWAKVEGPGGGGRNKPSSGGLPTNFLSSQFRPPPPPSIPINGAGGSFPGVVFTPPNKLLPPGPARTTPPRPTNKVPTAKPTTPTVVTTQKTATANIPVAEVSTSPTVVVSTVASTVVTDTAVNVVNNSTTTESASSTVATAATTTARFDDIRNVTEPALTPPTVTTQQPVQNNLILALVPIVIATVFLTTAGVLACLFRKRLFSSKVKSKKVNSIVSITIWYLQYTIYFIMPLYSSNKTLQGHTQSKVTKSNSKNIFLYNSIILYNSKIYETHMATY